MLQAVSPQANAPYAHWHPHPSPTALQPSLQITADCWALLAAPDGSSRKEHYLPKGERDPDSAASGLLGRFVGIPGGRLMACQLLNGQASLLWVIVGG